MNPGAMMTPRSSTPEAFAPSSQTTDSSTPSRTTISPGPSRPATGSTSQARERSRFGIVRPMRPGAPLARAPAATEASATRLPVCAGEEIQDRHSDRDAVGHLLGDHGATSAGHVRRDLDALVHRAGVHDENVGMGAGQSIPGDPEPGGVLAQRRQLAAGLALTLDSERH